MQRTTNRNKVKKIYMPDALYKVKPTLPISILETDYFCIKITQYDGRLVSGPKNA